MNAERQQRVEAVFAEALGVEESSRAGLIRERCGGDTSIEAEVLELLGFHEQTEIGPLDKEAAVARTRPSSSAAPALVAGMRVGHYVIESPLGEGGMGVVYVARQERPRRTVALKLIRPGFATPSLLKRFENEAEVLGKLHHPGIAQIFEAGTADTGFGPQPYFAMELVDGPPLMDFTRGKSTTEKVAILVKACRAVEHAHQRGVIHRDLKPANILVDKSGQPKILDFGVARATSRDHAASMVETRAGQLVGTLPYMSPEQVGSDPGDIDTRADVYALGVILYQLLTGRLPHDLASVSLPDAARLIREVTAAPLSRHDTAYRGDLDTIASRAMAKERHRRYQSAAELADELERYLSGRPIEARKDSTFYVLGKHLRRRWALASVSAASLILLLVFAVLAARQASLNRQLAEDNGLLAEKHKIARDKFSTSRDQLAVALEATKQAQARAELELSSSNIERARLLTENGDTEEALKLFWGEFFRRPDSAHAQLALWGFYAHSPIMTIDSTLRVDTPVAYPFSDGRLVAIPGPGSGADSTIQIYDTVELKRRSLVVVGGSRYTDVAVSRDGTLLAVGSYSGEIKLFRTSGERVTTEPMKLDGPILSVAISPDNTTLVASSQQRFNGAFDIPSGKKLAVVDLQGPTQDKSYLAFGNLSFTPTGKLYGSTWAGTVDELNPRTLETVRTASLTNERFDCFALSPSGSTAACVSYGGTLLLIDLETLTVARRWTTGRCAARGVQFIDDGKSLITCGSAIRLWTDQGQLQSTLGSNADLFCALAYLPQSKRIVNIGSSASMRIVDRDPQRSVQTIYVAPQSVLNTCSSRDGRVICFAANANRLSFVDPTTGSILAMGPESLAGAWGAAFGPDNSLYLACESAQLSWIDLTNGELQLGERLGETGVFSIAVNKQGTLVAAGDQSGVIHIVDTATRKKIRSIKVGASTVRSVRFSTDGATVFALENEITAIDTATGTTKPGLIPGKGYTNFAVSPDGKWVACFTSRTIDLIELAKPGQTPRRFAQSGPSVTACAFSPDSRMLITGHQEGTVRGWDVQTGQIAVILRDTQNRIAAVEVTPDGSRLVLATGSGRAVIRNLTALDVNFSTSLQWAREFLKYADDGIDRAAAARSLDELERRGACRMFWGSDESRGAGIDPSVIAGWKPDTTTSKE